MRRVLPTALEENPSWFVVLAFRLAAKLKHKPTAACSYNMR